MNKKQGFTLIELLAVVVIIAILLLIAVPVTINLITKLKISSTIKSAENYLDTLEKIIVKENMSSEFNPSSCKVLNQKQIECDDKVLKVIVKGMGSDCGTIMLNNGQVVKVEGLQVGDYTVFTDENNKLQVSKVRSCNINTGEDESSLNEELEDENSVITPTLVDNLIPIKYDGTNWIIADKTKDDWYNYEKQEWANAAILSVDKEIGNTIDITSEVKAMFVWIPRYEYKIEGQYGTHVDGTLGTQTLPGEIKINFISKKNETPTKGYKIHPAFTFGDRNLSGIWVGKFETSHSDSYINECNDTSCSAKYKLACTNENCKIADGIRIVPNVGSTRANNISKFYFAARSMSRGNNAFGLNHETTDTHLMKNSEWGAVAYLSQSKYGKYGNSMYSGVNKEIYQNKSTTWTTGNSNGTPSQSTRNEQCAYDDIIDRGNGTGSCGGGASTTGNITGIYDMSGGAFEMVMSNYLMLVSSSGFGFDWMVDEYNDKYRDIYFSTNLEEACDSKICYGHALSETSGWYSDKVADYTDTKSWSIRGGGLANPEYAGIFYYSTINGAAQLYGSYRIVLIKT